VPEREIRVDTGDGPMTTFVAHPGGDGPFPVAVLYMDAIGYREQVRENARRFAAGGFFCVAPDLFHHFGEGVTFDMARIAAEGFGGPEGRRVMELVGSLTPEMAEADTRAVLAAVESEPAAGAGPKVCVGYCMGARFSLHAAAALADDVVAAAGIHPGPLVTDAPDSPHHELAAVRGELYLAFADIDRAVTPEVVERFRAEMERTGVRGAVERVPGVAHGFAMADLPVYDRDACERHFERTLELWRRNATPEPAAP
jgi:carboxymethylenebutenolidase